MILLLMEQALAQFCPSAPSLGVPNAVVLFNGSSWSLNTPLAVRNSTACGLYTLTAAIPNNLFTAGLCYYLHFFNKYLWYF